MSFKFSTVESATAGNYLKPGIYKMKVSDVKEGVYEESKIPYLDIFFENVDDDSQKLKERFNLASKKESDFDPLSRLQYLHEGWSGKKLDKDFDTLKELAAYFKKAFTNAKAGSRKIVVGGEINGETTYARLPLAGFILENDAEVGEFEQGDSNWKKYVKVSTRKSESAGAKNGILNDADDDSPKAKNKAKSSNKESADKEDDSDDGLPW